MIRNLSIRLPAAALACGLAACFDNTGGPDYDVPAGQYLTGAHLQADADGTLRILAKVAMIYTYAGPIQGGYPRFQASNYQAVLFSRSASGWQQHFFRNLDRNEWTGSTLLPDESGILHACVREGESLRLHRQQQGAWIPGRARGLPQMVMYNASGNYAGRLPGLGLSGDSAWVLAAPERRRDTEAYRFQLRYWHHGEEGPLLDSTANFSPLDFHSRGGFHYLAGLDLGYSNFRPSPFHGDLVYYRWKSGSPPGEVRKKTLWPQGEIGRTVFTTRNNELRLYAEIDSAVRPFILEGELDSALTPIKLSGVRANPKPSEESHTPPALDAAGCLHILSWTGYRIGSGGPLSGFTHVNSCATTPGKLSLPMPEPGLIALPWPELLATGDRLLAAFILQDGTEDGNPATFRPSWLYLAEYRNNQWNWEEVARYEAAKPQRNTGNQAK